MRLAVLLVGILLLPAASALVAPPPPPVPVLDPAVVDPAWLASTYATLAARHPTLLDVGYAAVPTLHVEALFAGPVPADLGSLHPWLPTVGVDASGWAPLSHDEWVPIMLLLAQQVPPGIRPGSWMLGPAACTMAHVVEDAAANLYILTAGHCVDFVPVGARVSLVGEGDIGFVAARHFTGVGQDWAVVRIDGPHLAKVDPSMVGWHGPTGIASAPEDGLAKQYGWGYQTWMGHATRCRAGSTQMQFWGHTSWGYQGQVANGDSGSGVNSPSGAAMGILTHGGSLPGPNVRGTRITHALASAGAALGTTFSVVDGTPQLPVCDVVAG